MAFMKKVTIDLLLVATGATVVLAAGVGSAVIGTQDGAKYGKAQPDAQAITSGGSNRTISTDCPAANVDAAGDHAGVNMGKLLSRGVGGQDAE